MNTKQTKLYETIRRNQTLKVKWFSEYHRWMKKYLELLRDDYKGEVDQNKRSAIKLKADLIKKEMET